VIKRVRLVPEGFRGFVPGKPVKESFASHCGEIDITTLTLAEMRRGIELKGDTKARCALECEFDFVLEDYREAIYVFDEVAAAEWGRIMAEFKTS
jgi:predicted nucleic acid-binding protein